MREERDDPDAGRRQRALFRFAIIGELDIEALPHGERSARLAELATRRHRPPGAHERRVRVRTLRAWGSAYRRQGLDALPPRRRPARGPRRAVPPAPPAPATAPPPHA